MKEDGLGRLFVRQLVMAVPWGIVALAVFFVAAGAMKQEVKEAIQYSAQTALSETIRFVQDTKLVGPVKQNAKESIEFTAITAKRQIKELLNDPRFKQNLREALGPLKETSK